MIDNRRFSRGADLNEQALKEVTVRRLKSEITSKSFKTRAIRPIPFIPADTEQDVFEQLAAIVARSKKMNGREQGGDLVGMLLKKRFMSSPLSFGRTLAAYLDTLSNGTSTRNTVVVHCSTMTTRCSARPSAASRATKKKVWSIIRSTWRCSCARARTRSLRRRAKT